MFLLHPFFNMTLICILSCTHGTAFSSISQVYSEKFKKLISPKMTCFFFSCLIEFFVFAKNSIFYLSSLLWKKKLSYPKDGYLKTKIIPKFVYVYKCFLFNIPWRYLNLLLSYSREILSFSFFYLHLNWVQILLKEQINATTRTS